MKSPAARNRNLYTSDLYFSQYPTLRFKNSTTEQSFRKEAYRYSYSSILWLLSYFTITLSIFTYLGASLVLPFLPIALVAVLYFNKPCLGIFATRICLDIIITGLSTTMVNHGGYAEALGIFLSSFLANYFTVKSWSYFIPSAVVIACVHSVYFDVNLIIYASAIISYCLIGAALEKDYRDLWILYYSYKKSDIQHRSLFYEDCSPLFILSLDARIIYHNKQAAFLVKLQNKPIYHLNQGHIIDVFNIEHRDRISDLINNAIQGETREDEFIFNYNEEIYHNEDKALGYIVRVEPIPWRTGNSIKITFHDISHLIAIRLMFSNLIRNLKLSILYFNKELERMYEFQELPTKETLFAFNRYTYEYKAIAILYIQFLSRLETRSELFDIYTQVQNIIEKSFFKAESRGVDILLAKDGELADVYGDKSHHNLLIKALLDYAISKADDGSEVALLCGVAPPIEGQQVINYRINFRSYSVTNEELERLFMVRKSSVKRHSLKEIFHIVRNFGVSVAIIDTLLMSMKGYIVDTYAQGDTSKKAGIIIQVPFIEKKGEADHKVLRLYPESIKQKCTGSGTIKWKASRVGMSQMIRPIPNHLDGTTQLMNQLDLVRRNKKRNKTAGSLLLKDCRELQPQNSLTIIPEKTIEIEIRPMQISKVYNSSKSMNVSLIRVQKPTLIESPILSPNITDIDEPVSSVDTICERKPYKRRGCRRATHPKSNFRPSYSQSPMNTYLSDLTTPKPVTESTGSYGNKHHIYSPRSEDSPKRIRKFISDSADMNRTVDILTFESGPAKILLIDSSDISRLAIKEQIKRELESEVDTGEDGEEALKMYLNYSKNGFMYFLILMETLMPNLDGYQTAKMIRAIESKHGFPRSYIVGLSSEESVNTKYWEYGMNYLIKKPSTIEDISRMIQKRKYLIRT